MMVTASIGQAAATGRANVSARPAVDSWEVEDRYERSIFPWSNNGTQRLLEDMELPDRGGAPAVYHFRDPNANQGRSAALGAAAGALAGAVACYLAPSAGWGLAIAGALVAVGGLIGAAVHRDQGDIPGTIKLEAGAGLVFEPDELRRFGTVDLEDFARAPVGSGDSSDPPWWSR
ncbi:MAG: hypothetical protein HY319_32730 [Armatimonadetes bacterium]|nr:hypothetical protein [Armatimonadota bacterium]